MVRSKQARAMEAPTLPVPDHLWGVAEVARFLKVGKPQVYQMVREQGLPHMWCGNRLRFHQTAVAHWVEKRQQVIA